MHRTVVNPGIDEELDKMKRTYDGIENLLNRISQEIVATIPVQYSLDLNVIFFPQIGFLISISMDPETGQASYEGGEAEEERWERIFSTENRAYYKDQRMRELDNTFGDLYAVICGMQIRGVLETNSSANRWDDYRQGNRDCPRAWAGSLASGGNAEMCI